MSDDIEYIWITDADARIKFELPTSWSRKPPSNPGTTGVKAMAPDETAALDFVFISRGTPETVAEEKRILGELDKHLTDVRVTAPASNIMQGTLRVFGMAGVGKADGISITWYSAAYGDGMGHGVLVTGLIHTAKLAAHKNEIDRISRSIMPYAPPA